MKIRLPNYKEFSPQLLRRLSFLSVALFATGLFFKLTWELKTENELLRFDEWCLALVGRGRIPALNGPMVDITALGSGTLAFLLGLTVLTILILIRDRRGAVYFVTSVLGGAFFSTFLKLIVKRERPTIIPRLVEVSNYSYPSGHTVMSTVMFLSLAFLACRFFKSHLERLVIFLFASLFITLVGVSRIYLGAHYPSDVISGILFGAAWTFALSAFYFSHPNLVKSDG